MLLSPAQVEGISPAMTDFTMMVEDSYMFVTDQM
jgi:acetyl-CoA carboxylase carboxyltransferase component